MSFDRRAIPDDARFGNFVTPDGWSLRTYGQSARAAARGSILWLGGRGDIVEKYIEAIDGWAGHGWDVTSFDWRGQGGSGRVGPDPAVGHIDDFATWIDDLATFHADWTSRTPGPHIVMGHSMGGHLLLRALAEKRITPDKAVLVAPMLGFESRGIPQRLAHGVAALMAKLAGAARPAWKHNERPAPPSASREAFLTHDHDRYSDEMWWKDHNPGLAIGPPSWPWLAAAYASMARLAKPGAVEGVMTPVLILCADADQLVSARAIRAYAARLPNARLVRYDSSVAHEILRESDPVRDMALNAIDEFLAS